MKLTAFEKDPDSAWLYCERYINKGSPSGYTSIHHLPAPFDPKSKTECFKLSKYAIDGDEVKTYGEMPKELELGEDLFGCWHKSFFIHPLTCKHKDFSSWFGIEPNQLKVYSNYRAAPTASGRTVWIGGSSEVVHLKLHYHGVIGRVNRSLPYQKAIAGPELWCDTKFYLDSGEIPKSLAFLPEVAARIWEPRTGSVRSIGFIVREGKAYPREPGRYVIPCFSLFSEDIRSPHDRLLIFQLLDRFKNPADSLFEYLLKPIIKSYVFLVFNLGILPELNAQNILIELSNNFIPTRIVLRDMSHMEKNLALRRELGLKTDFRSGDYKCIDALKDKSYSEIRHSFSYDFKLGQYVLAELIDCCSVMYNFRAESLDRRVGDLFEKLVPDCKFKNFPAGNVWFSHDNIMLTGLRPYMRNVNPRFRRIR